MDLVGKYIGSRYEIIEKVGNGGMATVYKAKCHVLNRYVAVKVLKEEFTTDEEFIRRFNVEAQSAAGLTHPNIVSVYDVGHEDGIYYIVMELIQGKTLKQIINEDGALPWKWSVNIAIQIASALEAAHKNNIVHRDIKPHNIIITEDGVAKVTDFGIAKAVSNSTITAFGTTIGSVHYFSPEHAKGSYTDAKSDLYSLGVVMYEMLTGRVPFDADTPVSIALKHMQEKAIEPIKLNPSIPFAVNQIIVKAMQKEPSMRYQSATEMLKDLSMALKNPEGNFVEEKSADINYTQRIGTITDEMLEENKKKTTKKKKGKLKEYFEKHPKMKIPMLILTFIIIFILTIFITKFAMDAGTVKSVQVPNLVGKTETEVQEMLKGTKFTYEIKSEEYNSEYDAGKVISQDPAYRNNYTIKENSKLLLVISKGTEMTTVPKIAGMEYEAAVKELNNAKLKPEKIEEISEKVQEGYVIKQDPAENTEAKAGDTIKVYVSIGNGKEQVTITNVVGKTEADAKKELENAKLKVEIVYDEDTTKTDGTVLKQSIGVGEVVEEGTTIVLTVNKLAEIKQGTININLKSILRYSKPQTTTNEIVETPKSKVTVKVTSAGVEDTIYDASHTNDTSKITVQVKGVGTITVKVFIDGALGTRTQTLNLNSSNPVLNFE